MTKRESLKDAAERVDRKYDAMLYDGMPIEDARRVEIEREQAHQRLADEALRKALR